MAVISLKLPDALDAELSLHAERHHLSKSELMRRALKAFLQASAAPELGSPPSAADLVADLVGCCKGAPADLSANTAYLSGFGES
ncbi:MAG: ribbon-helix-helix protein, CopG family [Prochlorococcus sp.]